MTDKKDNFLVDVIAGVFFLIFCVFFLVKSAKLPAGAALFPDMVIWSLVLCSLGLIGTAVRRRCLSRKKEEIKQNNKQRKPLFTREKFRYEFFPIAFFLIVIMFIILLPLIGFEYATFIFMLTGMWLINKNQLKRNFYIPFLIPIILTLLFRIILNVSLPASNLPIFPFNN